MKIELTKKLLCSLACTILLSACSPSVKDVSDDHADYLGKIYRTETEFLVLPDNSDPNTSKYMLREFTPTMREQFNGVPAFFGEIEVQGFLPKGTLLTITRLMESTGSDAGDIVYPIVRVDSKGPLFGKEITGFLYYFVNSTATKQLSSTNSVSNHS